MSISSIPNIPHNRWTATAFGAATQASKVCMNLARTLLAATGYLFPVAVYNLANVLRLLTGRTGVIFSFQIAFTCPVGFWLGFWLQTAILPALVWNAVATAKVPLSNPESQQVICSMYRFVRYLTLLPCGSPALQLGSVLTIARVKRLRWFL